MLVVPVSPGELYLQPEPVRFRGDYPEHGQLHHQDPGLALGEAAALHVPGCAFQEQAGNKAACAGREHNIPCEQSHQQSVQHKRSCSTCPGHLAMTKPTSSCQTVATQRYIYAWRLFL